MHRCGDRGDAHPGEPSRTAPPRRRAQGRRRRSQLPRDARHLRAGRAWGRSSTTTGRHRKKTRSSRRDQERHTRINAVRSIQGPALNNGDANGRGADVRGLIEMRRRTRPRNTLVGPATKMKGTYATNRPGPLAHTGWNLPDHEESDRDTSSGRKIKAIPPRIPASSNCRPRVSRTRLQSARASPPNQAKARRLARKMSCNHFVSVAIAAP